MYAFVASTKYYIHTYIYIHIQPLDCLHYTQRDDVSSCAHGDPYFAPGEKARSVLKCTSLGVLLRSVREHISETAVQSSPHWHLLPLVVARSFSDGVVIHYVLPVLWMTSC